MTNFKDHKENNSNLYLESPEAFHLKMPLYNSFNLSDDVILEKVYKCVSYSGTIDAYCIYCKSESVFKTLQAINYGNRPYSTPSSAIKDWAKATSCDSVLHSCTRVPNSEHTYIVYYLKMGTYFTKIGQWPSISDIQQPERQKYRKILKDYQYKEFTKSIRLASHGVGIGSFVYLRRIFESLIEEACQRAQVEKSDFSSDEYKKSRMDQKIKLVEDFLPRFLVENRALYAILSKGIHELSENECLEYFETVKSGIEQILDEKIFLKEKEEKVVKAREAIQKVHGKLNNT